MFYPVVVYKKDARGIVRAYAVVLMATFSPKYVTEDNPWGLVRVHAAPMPAGDE